MLYLKSLRKHTLVTVPRSTGFVHILSPRPPPRLPPSPHSHTLPNIIGLCSEKAVRDSGTKAEAFCPVRAPVPAHKSAFSSNHSSGRKGVLLCDGTLELGAHTATSIRARPYARSWVGRRVRGREEGRTAGGAASREYDGRRTRMMGVGPLGEPASSSSPFVSMRTASNSTVCEPVKLSPDVPLVKLSPDVPLVKFDPDASCSAASPISARLNT